jgi:hypothetical protein
MIANAYKSPPVPTDGFSGIYFLDSLNCHPVNAITSKVRKWLNEECKWQQEQTPCRLPDAMLSLLSQKSSHPRSDKDWFPFSKHKTPTVAPEGMPPRCSSG